MSELLNKDAWRKPWFGQLAPYERVTGDRRIFTTGALGHRTLPMPLMLQTSSAPGHFGAITVGTIRAIGETSGGRWSTGTWLDPQAVPEVERALGLMAGQVAYVSPDLEPGSMVITSEMGEDGKPIIRYERATMSGATIVPVGAFDQPSLSLYREGQLPDGLLGAVNTEEDVFTLTGTTSWRSMKIAPREYKFDADAAVKRILAWANGSDTKARTMFLWQNPEEAVGTRARWNLPVGDIFQDGPHLVFHAVYAAAAILSGAHGGMDKLAPGDRQRLMTQITEMYQRMAQAFSDPNLQAPWVKRGKLPQHQASVTASAAPLSPPASWFTDDGIDGPVTVSDDGRVRGLLARWDTCHTAFTRHGNCVTAPHSKTGYQHFTTGAVATADGRQVPVGRITMDTTHPVGEFGAMMTASQAAQFYDNTGSQVAIVAAGENRHGIWVSGSVVPEATPEQVARLRRSPLSGDWRDVGGNLELVAALAVNSPGFPVVRINGGNRFSLTASSAVMDTDCPNGVLTEDVDNDAMGENDKVQDVVVDAVGSDGAEAPPAGDSAAGTKQTTEPTLTAEQVAAIVSEQMDQRSREVAERRKLAERLETHQLIAGDRLTRRFNTMPKPTGFGE